MFALLLTIVALLAVTVANHEWRLLSGAEALNSVLLAGWSTSRPSDCRRSRFAGSTARWSPSPMPISRSVTSSI
jgi:hypothetical protein